MLIHTHAHTHACSYAEATSLAQPTGVDFAVRLSHTLAACTSASLVACTDVCCRACAAPIHATFGS